MAYGAFASREILGEPVEEGLGCFQAEVLWWGLRASAVSGSAVKYLAPNKFTVNDQNGEEPFFTSNETVITGRCDICGNGTDATVTVENAFRQRKLKLSHQSRPGHPHAQK